MSAHQSAGSALAPQVVDLEPVSGVGKTPAAGERQLGAGSFSNTFNWRGNGTVVLNLRDGRIGAGSRVTASISEYNTAWNVDRFIGNASMQVLNVSPYNGGCRVRAAINWSGPINNCITLLVDP